jgi:predicted nucleic acid-binding protein
MFWDSSALVPLLVAEACSRELVDLLGRDAWATIWWSSEVECRSALQRRWREQVLAGPDLHRALTRLEALVEDIDQIAPAPAVKVRAARLLTAHPLPAADALQLAAALVWCDDTPSGESFVCLDDRLAEAAVREGFRVLPATIASA